MSPPTRSIVFGSSGIWPDRYTVLPERTACEYGPMAAGAFGLVIGVRDMAGLVEGSP